MCEHSFNLSIPIIGPKIQVEPVLHRLGLGNPSEQETRELFRRWSNLELVGIVIHDDAQVIELHARKLYGEPEQAVFTIEEA